MAPVAMQTAQDLLRFREPGKTAELVRGVLIVREPPGTGHGARAARLTVRVGAFVERHDLGQVYAQDTGFKIERDPDTVRAPDVAFVARQRLAHLPDEGNAELAPDWAAEIGSPNDPPGEGPVEVGPWLGAGARVRGVLGPGRAWVGALSRAPL